MLAKPRILFAALAVALAACGGSDDGADVDASAAGEGIDAAAGSGAEDASAGDSDADPGAADAGDSDADVQEGVACGDQTCGEGTECCFEGFDDPVCVEVDTCEGATVGCAGPADCPEEGEVCCASLENTETSCVAEDSCNVALCDDEDDCTNDNHQCCDAGDFGLCSPFCI